MPGLEIRGYKVFGNDFTDVDFREELCHHSLTEYGKISESEVPNMIAPTVTGSSESRSR